VTKNENQSWLRFDMFVYRLFKSARKVAYRFHYSNSERN